MLTMRCYITTVAVAAALLLPVMPAAHAGQGGSEISVPSKQARARTMVRPPIYNSVPMPPAVERDPVNPFIEPWNNPNYHGSNGG